MASIYIHIPYCKQACHYCNFYFSTKLKTKSQFLNALQKEIIIKQKYINDTVNSVYIGGGTPSVLSFLELEKIITLIKNNFNIDNDVEVTIEINPDFAEAFFQRGCAKHNAEDYKGAIEDFNTSINLQPKNKLFYKKRQ